MVDPFSSKTDGARVPSLTQDSTITTHDYQTCQFTADSTGRALLVINYDALRTSPYILVNGPTNDFNDTLD